MLRFFDRYGDLFAGDEPAETLWGLLIVWPFFFLFGTPLLAAQLTETTRDFTLVVLTGWVLVATVTIVVCRRVKRGREAFGSLVAWLGTLCSFTPVAAALLYLAWSQRDSTLALIVVLLQAGMMWGALSSYRFYRDRNE
jgi:hypothetical protein